MQEEIILQKLLEHDKRFDEHDKRFDEHDKRFDEHDKRFDNIDKRLDKLTIAVVNLQEQSSKYATNERVDALEERIMSALDQQLVILQRLDQEHTFTIEWIKRIEGDVARIKMHLKLA